MVRPSPFSSDKILHTSRRALASRPMVSSSRNTSSGLGIRARTINSRWRSPPDRLLTAFFSLPPIPNRRHSSRQSAGRLYRQAVSSHSSNTLISGW